MYHPRLHKINMSFFIISILVIVIFMKYIRALNSIIFYEQEKIYFIVSFFI